LLLGGRPIRGLTLNTSLSEPQLKYIICGAKSQAQFKKISKYYYSTIFLASQIYLTEQQA
jgi:hypothetical protein